MTSPDPSLSRSATAAAAADDAFAAEADGNPYLPTRRARTAPDQTPRLLWGAVGGLTLAVAALGGTLLYQQGRQSAAAPMAMAPASAAPSTLAGNAVAPVTIADADKAAAVARLPLNPDAPQPAAAAPASPPRATTSRPVASTRTPDYGSPPAQAYPVARPDYRPDYRQAAACQSCGRVESVQPVVQQTETPNVAGVGIGAVAGGVLGGLLGNQVGKGNGRTVATVLGAVGGGYAGHTVEQRMRTTTAYQVRVRMDDGRVRSFRQAQPMAVGEPVRVEGNALYAAPAQRYGDEGGRTAPTQPGLVYARG